MSLCEHGYTANWDCPFCECPCGSGLPCDQCDCQGDPSNVIESAAPLPATPPPSSGDAAVAADQDIGMCPWCGEALHPGRRCHNDDLLAQFAELVLTVAAARSVS